MVMEVLGCNLLRVIKQFDYHGIPLPFLKRVIRQTLEGLDYLHSDCRIIHTDIKPENILLYLTPKEVETLAERAQQGLQQGAVATPLGREPIPVSKKLSKNQKKNLKNRRKKKAGKSGGGTTTDEGGDEDLGSEDTVTGTLLCCVMLVALQFPLGTRSLFYFSSNTVADGSSD